MMTLPLTRFLDDLDEDWGCHASEAGSVAWDIETTGLDWATSRVATCQLATRDRVAVVQLRGSQVPKHLSRLLADAGVTKVFHHAPFDLRFMAHAWGVRPVNVACTKVAAKIAEPGLVEPKAYSLEHLLRRHLGVEIDKGQQVSDWANPELSDAQVRYAVNDVIYLEPLLEVLLARAANQGSAELVAASYAYLPTRVELDISGVGDVFLY